MGRGLEGLAATPEELERGERFLSAYNVIEQAMQRKLGDPGRKEGFRRLIDRLAGCDWTVRRWKDDLVEFAELRNAIVHERVSPEFLIAVPLDGTVELIERIAADMERPELVYPRFRREVMGFQTGDSVKKVLSALDATGYSQFPVYREGRYLGLLTDGGIARWLARSLAKGSKDLTSAPLDLASAPLNLTVGEVLKSEKNPDRARFIPKTATLYQAESMFAGSGDSWRVAALFITESGTPGETLLGIVTPHDILTLDRDRREGP